MQQISLYLEPFKSLGLENILFKETIREVVLKHTGVKLETKDISLHKNNISLTVSPIQRSEVFIKREQIIKDIVDTLGKKQAPKLM